MKGIKVNSEFKTILRSKEREKMDPNSGEPEKAENWSAMHQDSFAECKGQTSGNHKQF